MSARDVCVIVAAFHAERTIARAIRSALDQAEVAEVVVADDASGDATVATAWSADDGTGRLRVLTQPANAGPAAARNRAIAESHAPLIAILDADDYLLPGRFGHLLATGDWDMIADNIAFVPEAAADLAVPTAATHEDDRAPLSLGAFVAGNLSRPDQPRGELGFLKPVMRRDLLDRRRLRYDETLRLGEDYALYVRLLAAGARFVTTRACGYVAIERAASLSGRHRTSDLAALAASDRELLRDAGLSPADRDWIRRHLREVEDKHHHRAMLDVRRERGRFAAMSAALAAPARLPTLIGAVLRDKLRRAPAQRASGEVRYLFD